MARKRAVLTGGAGFVGSHLAERLLERDIDVVCIDNFVTGSARNVAHLGDRCEMVQADVSAHIFIPGPVDYVLHLASPASPLDYAQLPIQTMKAGALGTWRTLGLAKAKGARYLLASTSETYGDPLVHPQTEDYWGNVNPVGPRACYDEAKRYAEALTMSYRKQHGVDTAIMRIFNTYGPRMRADDGRAVPRFIEQALAGRPLTVHGDGSQTRSLCYVDDLVDGVLRLLFSDLGGPVNLGNPVEMTVLELAGRIVEMADSASPIAFTPRPYDDPERRLPDITLARTELGWEPRTDIRSGLRQTIDWFRDRTRARAGTPITVRAPDPPGLRVAVVGTGYVGAVTAVCLSALGNRVCGLDSDEQRAALLNSGEVPFHEPGLSAMLVDELSSGRLRFTDRVSEALRDAAVIFMCVGTPPGPGGAPDLTQLEDALRSVAPYLGPDVVVVNKSTVPVGSGNWTRTILEEALPDARHRSVRVVSNPEFLREGSAINDFLFPDRIVLGGDAADVNLVGDLYRPVLEQSFPGGTASHQPELITVDLPSAEMVKYAANAFLATKISFANEMAMLCELLGADVREVLPAIGADRRVGREFLQPGVGWGGSCFGKDLAGLIATGHEYGYAPPMLQATVQINEMQRANTVRKLQRELHVLKGRRIALLGLTFKPGTDDLRDAPALDIAGRLITAGALVSAYDPKVLDLPAEFGAIRRAGDPYAAADRADAVVLVTEWPEFRDIDAVRLASVMRGHLVIDGRNFLPQRAFQNAGLRMVGFGY